MSSDLSPGAVFAERYRVERRIATGGMGAVYEVVHLETNRRRALKVLHANLVQSEELRERFRREARVAAEIESEHIVDVFDAGIDTATEMPFLVMELLRGEDVRQRIKRAGPIPFDETVRILFEAALALDKTHQARIVHRDLKPDNLYLCERDHGPPRVKVLDFGIAKIVADGQMSGQTKESLGTPLYMAPEQYLMSAKISGATDIFALGLISFTMLVGKPYWLEETMKAGAAVVFAMHACKGPQESAVKRAQNYGVTLPPAFDEWFFKATASKSEDRFQSATTAITELAQVLGIPLFTETGPVSMPGPTSGRVGMTSISGVNVKSVLTSSSSGLIPPMRPEMASIPGTISASQSGLTPIGSGLTNADPPPARRQNLTAIAGGAIATLVIGGFIAYRVLANSSGPTNSDPIIAAPTPTTSASAFVLEPEVKPTPTQAPADDLIIEPAPSADASSTKTSKPVKGATSPTSTPTATTRPTSTATTKKTSSGGGLWHND